MGGSGTGALRDPTTLDKVMDFFGHPNPNAFPSLRTMQKEAPILRVGDINFREEYFEIHPNGKSEIIFRARVGIRTIRIRFGSKAIEWSGPNEMRVVGVSEEQMLEYARLLRGS